jgi:Mitochondrial ribosomal protein subunit L20
MRELRNHPDPEKRKSRNEIAKMFGCSQFFVGMAAPLSKQEVKEVFQKRQEERDSWGMRKRFYRDERQRRRQEWVQSEE